VRGRLDDFTRDFHRMRGGGDGGEVCGKNMR